MGRLDSVGYSEDDAKSISLTIGITIGYTIGEPMRVVEKRWGEVTIKKQGTMKNQFDASKSFSIEKTKHYYTIGQLKDLMARIVNLTQTGTYAELSAAISELEKEGKKRASKDQ